MKQQVLHLFVSTTCAFALVVTPLAAVAEGAEEIADDKVPLPRINWHRQHAPPHLPGLLALVGGFALLYGAYEYRHDVANKIRTYRTNRAARAAAR